MFRIGSILIALSSWIVSNIAFISLLPGEAWAADCSQWDIGGHWEFRQTNGIVAKFDLQQTNNVISGTGRYDVNTFTGPVPPPSFKFGERREGPVTGSINGNGNIQLMTSWVVNIPAEWGV